ncbi:hypothetical protein HHK36_018679 [Tetracentron sinense]|uniref:DUF7356 domain-containing protein n=1 Tax=Tetracentron sinense TaxID=13715 RepID=A0A834Z4E6_TETSI|nr:hypothetical protein HHK36_018679 [Tetracentron sinense]
MDRKGVLAVILLILVVAEGSDASLFDKFRRLVETGPNEAPSPISNDLDGRAPQSPLTETHKDGPTGSRAITDKNCEGISPKCDHKNLIACIRHAESGLRDEIGQEVLMFRPSTLQEAMGHARRQEVKLQKLRRQSQFAAPNSISAIGSVTRSHELFLVVQNEGEITLIVNVMAPPSVNFTIKKIIILEHQAEKINFSMISENATIVLNAGNVDCELDVRLPVSEGNFFNWLPYATRVTPIYGAYFLFLTAMIVGVTWACCKLGKRERRGDGGVQYQELEMGFPESVSANNVDTANGWDEGWDDDWDEENAVKSPGGYHVGNVSANGLTSRPSNKDGWEND